MFGLAGASSKSALREKWAHDKLTPALEPLILVLLKDMPENPKVFMAKYLAEKQKGNAPPVDVADDEHRELAKRTTRKSIVSVAGPVAAGAPSATKRLTAQAYKELRKKFQQMDLDGSNSLSITELAVALQLDLGQLSVKMRDLDPDHDGQVSFQELVAALYHTPPPVAKKSDKPVVEAGEMFTDPEFPPSDDSVFNSSGYAGDGVEAMKKAAGESPKWVRASELTHHGCLFNHIHPNDIAQGQVGDCWLLAGLAGMAEFEGSVMHMFEEKKASTNGMYNVRIFDPVKKEWEIVTIDDYIPVLPNGQPLSAKPQGNEMWVLLLEKAFAKWFGSYCKLQGAYCLLPYMLLVDCGGPCRQYSQNYQGCEPFDTETYQGLSPHLKDSHDRTSIGLSLAPKVSSDELFKELCKADETNHLMCAWTMKDPPVATGVGASGEAIGSDGIVKGHAYSLITAMDLSADGKEWKVVQLRNPWGANPASEWKGKLSDNWDGWKTGDYPELMTALAIGSGALDGMFWMEWDDFRQRYSDIGVVPKEMEVPKLGSVERNYNKDDGKVGYKNFSPPSRV